ncbi:hypothetical protein TanjilG_19975 [Lupinus angustifolius]|uniref:DUF4408 domain-containing protein n=1 Tax=Lupinus angustifolius TaxID=3871 RepID=A0A4P1RCE0_LUPAN|nr:PREDICTED: cell division control protein 45 homolog isoform X1 [Lupinus angustifolius]OIW07874.1 hypothetical protein TanjilG_19975 [Lupinus angustifolius]
MLDSILEFMTQAASSSAFIFCFCNLIIVIILVDLKPSLSIHQQSEIPLHIVQKGTGSLPQEAQVSQVQEEKEAELDEETKEAELDEEAKEAELDEEAKEAELDEEAKILAANNIEIKGNDDWNNEEEESGEVEEDDELKRRVEEFIEKVNRGWKQELLSTSL